MRRKPGLEDEEERFVGAYKSVWCNEECLVAREGDHLVTPFECDLRMFVELKNRHPMPQSKEDKTFASCIRRMNLDAFWSRAPTTASNNLRLAKNLINLPKSVG